MSKSDTPKTLRLDPKIQRIVRIFEEHLDLALKQVDMLQDPERQPVTVLGELAKSFDRLALRARHDVVALTTEDMAEVNPLLRVTLLNIKSEVASAVMDLEVRPQSPTRWEDFGKAVAEVVKTARAVQQVIVQPGAAAHVQVQGEPLRTTDGQLLAEA